MQNQRFGRSLAEIAACGEKSNPPLTPPKRRIVYSYD